MQRLLRKKIAGIGWLAVLAICVCGVPASAADLGKTVEKWEGSEQPKQVYTWYRNGNRKIKHGWDVTYYENGQMSRKLAWVQGHLHGPYQTWYADGKPRETGAYVKGKAHGAWQTLHPDGAPARTCTYVAGQIEGQLKEWYPNGQLRRVAGWRKGKPHGPFETYMADGKPISAAAYADGMRDGIFMQYENGRRKLMLTYQKGKLDGPVTRWDANGKPLADGIYKKGEPYDGVCWESGDREGHYFLYTYKAGQLTDAVYYDPDGPFTGIVSEWHPDGVKARECDYVAGRKEGNERWYFPNGKPAAACVWRKNKLDGAYEEWHLSGKKKLALTLEDGKLHGTATHWDVRGQVVARGENRDDRPWNGVLMVTPKDGAEPFLQEFVDGRPINLAGDVSAVRGPTPGRVRPRAPDADLADPDSPLPEAP